MEYTEQQVATLVFKLIAEDKEIIAYRPRLNQITGSVTATILLQQIVFRYNNSQQRPFYKFRAPCAHQLYRPDDSWMEELAFTGEEFDSALKRIGTKVHKGESKFEALKKEDTTGLVIYWTDSNRITWYMVNVRLLGNLAFPIYLGNSGNPNARVMAGTTITLNSGNPELPLLQRSPETSSETTEEEVALVSFFREAKLSNKIRDRVRAAVQTFNYTVDEMRDIWRDYIQGNREIEQPGPYFAAILEDNFRPNEAMDDKREPDPLPQYPENAKTGNPFKDLKPDPPALLVDLGTDTQWAQKYWPQVLGEIRSVISHGHQFAFDDWARGVHVVSLIKGVLTITTANQNPSGWYDQQFPASFKRILNALAGREMVTSVSIVWGIV